MGYLSDAMNQPNQPKPDAQGPQPPPQSQPGPGHTAPPTPAPQPEQTSYRMADHAQRTFSGTAAVDDRVVTASKPSCVMAEEYRAIRTGILARWQQRRHLVHTITSATPQEGKTITSLNLGISFAEVRNRHTLLIEADLRLPRFQDLLRLQNTPGLIGLLENRAQLSQVTQAFDVSGLDVICAGGRASNDTIQMLSSARMTSLIKEARQKYDHVIIDTPPVVEFADAGIIGAMSDDVLLVVRMNRTAQPVVEHAIRALNSYNAPVAGLIATDQARSQRRYYYKYHYRHNHGFTHKLTRASRARAA